MITAADFFSHPLTTADLGLPAPHNMSAAIPLFVVAVLVWKRWLPRAAACFGLVAGTALSAGWLYDGIKTVMSALTDALSSVTRTTTGGVVPGAVGVILMIFFVVAIAPDRAMVHRLTGGPTSRQGRQPAGLGRGRGRFGRRAGASVGGWPGGGRGRGRIGARLDLWPSIPVGRVGLGGSADRPHREPPQKLGALTAGLLLPSVVHTIPGTLGVVAVSITNLVGGVFAWLTGLGFGLI